LEKEVVMKKAGIIVSLFLCLILLSTSAFAGGIGKRVTGQTIYVPIDYHQNFSFTILVDQPCPPCTLPPCPPCPPPVPSTVSQISNSRLIIRNLDLDNSLTVTSIRMFDPYGVPVEEFDCVVRRISLPITLYAGESMTLGVASPVFGPCGDPGLYHFTDGRPYLIVEWVSESKKKVIQPKIGATIFSLRFNDQRAPGMQSSGPELFNEYYQDGVVLKETKKTR